MQPDDPNISIEKLKNTMAEQEKKRRGCFFYGGITAVILLAIVIIAGIVGVKVAKKIVADFTDTEPLPMPRVEMSSAEISSLQARAEKFRDDVQQRRSVGPLELTADEVNALIANDPDLAALKNRLYLSFEGGQVKAQFSVPANEIGLEPLRGKYINATGTFKFSFHDGQLFVTAETISAKGKPLAETFMRAIRGQNLAEKFNSDQKVQAALSKLESIEVKDGKLVITPKPIVP